VASWSYFDRLDESAVMSKSRIQNWALFNATLAGARAIVKSSQPPLYVARAGDRVLRMVDSFYYTAESSAYSARSIYSNASDTDRWSGSTEPGNGTPDRRLHALYLSVSSSALHTEMYNYILRQAAKLGVFSPIRCIPATVAPWTPGAPTVLIGNMPALDSTSKCMCMWAGVIGVTNPGQTATDIP